MQCAFTRPPPRNGAAARARLGFTDEDFVVGMVAGFRAEKNHDVFFEGLSRAAPALPSLRVLAVGGGELLAQHRRAPAAATGLAAAHRVHRGRGGRTAVSVGHGCGLSDPRLQRGILECRDRADGDRCAHDRHGRWRQSRGGRGRCRRAGSFRGWTRRRSAQALVRMHEDAAAARCHGTRSARARGGAVFTRAHVR